MPQVPVKAGFMVLYFSSRSMADGKVLGRVYWYKVRFYRVKHEWKVCSSRKVAVCFFKKMTRSDDRSLFFFSVTSIPFLKSKYEI